MSAITRTVTINAAFLREIKEDNRELCQLLEQTRAVSSKPSPPQASPKQLVQLLTRVRDQLAMHFALEEAYGYFDDAVNVAPQLSARAVELRAQHKALFLNICDVVDQAERLLYEEAPHLNPGKISLQFERFCDRLQEHETHENELLIEAFSEDIGVAD